MRTPVPSAESPSTDSAVDVLVDAVGRLSLARDLETIQQIVRTAARRIVGADGATFVLRDGDKCFYADEDAIEPLWKGQRFPLQACISGWAMLHAQPAVIEDIYADDRIPHDAYRPTFVQSLVMVPIRTTDPIGAIGVYWATPHRATEREIGLACALADSTALAIEHVALGARAQDLAALSLTDPLTGLPNRRALTAAFVAALQRPRRPVAVLVVDHDHFKAYNDEHGHTAGDRLLAASAEAWSAALRPGDVLARYGGEEFVAVLPGCDEQHAREVAERLRAVTPEGRTISVGVAVWDGVEDAAELICRADEALYRAKHAGRDRVATA